MSLVRFFGISVVCLWPLLCLQGFATVSVEPPGVTFPTQAINTTSPLQNVAVFNVGTNTFTITGATTNDSAFVVVGASLPVTVPPNAFQVFQVQFTPTSAKTYSAKLTFTFTDAATQTVNLTGYGTNPNAIPSLNVTSLNFGNQTLGVNGPTQALTITNNGTVAVNLTGVTVTTPFTQTGWKSSIAINPGKSFTMQIGFNPLNPGLTSGEVYLTYDVAPNNGISLWGTAVAATSLGITSFPNLPAATQNAAYNAVLTAAGGQAPYTWTLASGSSLPSGLALSSSGVISGTVASSIALGTYSFSAKVTDSVSAGSTASFSVSVSNTTGASCNNISFNAPDGSGPLIPIMDLGTNLYAGAEEGGLYANGSNQDDPAHDAYGQGLAAAIQPLDNNGNPDPNGKYVLLAIGLSVTQQSFFQFVPMVNADPAKNPNLVVVDGGSGGATVAQLTGTTNNSFWESINNVYLPNAGVTPNQVVAVFFMDTDGGPSGTFPSDMTTLQSQMETTAQNMFKFFPNIKIAYATSMYYMGYSNGVKNLDPEPYAYESGFAVKNMIQDQINGNANLNFDPSKGTVMAPWLAWGPYIWANGLTPRSDGLVWSCQDLQSDGTHPEIPNGRIKVSSLILNFFKTDDTASPWFLAPSLGLTATGGNNQSGGAGTLLPTALTVLASNLNGGAPEPGVSVTFSDGGAGGTFGTPVATTDSNGDASTTYTLPATAQTVTITATSAGYKSASFTETATAPVLALAATGGNNQSGGTGTTLPAALTVLATSGGNPVSGVSVAFSDGGAGGNFGTPVAITGSNGMASTTYTLPPTAQVVTINATSSGYSAASFNETATLLVITPTAGNNQTAIAGSVLPTALVASATSNGSPVQGVSVTFNDGGSGGSFGTPVATTDSNGNATTTYTLPPTAQTVTISATSPTYTPASFTETANAPIVLALTPTAGNNQSGGTGTTLPSVLTVTATSNGTPVQGVSVSFSDGGVGGNFGTPVVTTAADGTASTTYTLPATAQTVNITATSSGYTSATLTETANVLALSPTAGNNQTGGVGSTLPAALTVFASSNGSPAAGVSVMFSDGGAGGLFGNSVVTTDANGNASTTYTLPTTAQTVNITASSSGYTSAAFTETAAVCALSATGGNNQSGMVSTLLPTALTVLASCNGSPVSGVSVAFSDAGAGGAFGSPVATTNGSGIASTTYTLPAAVETVTITAASSGYTSTTFSETSTPFVATITVVSGGKQSGTVGTTLPLPIVVKAKNSAGQAVSGAPITFANGGIGGTFSPNPAITGSNGQASVTFTLPTVAKKMTVTASDGSVSVNITETSVAGPPTTFAIVSGNNQTAHPNTKLLRNLVVSVKDQYGNGISGVTVTLTDNGAGGIFSTTTPVTTSTGQASVSYTTGSKTGTVTISASTSTLGPLNFTETVK